ncbi:MAG TPA: FAD-binding oxidoreductase [Casimicrobiaceae bacterium]|nr:FAD-binding oxidoreductase [Casimicrobiaceae bacterium]
MKLEAPAARYDPRYDPLVTREPGCNQDYPPSYWAASAGTPPGDDGPVSSDTDVDVAIIGAGYTGLATAIFLAREHGIRATVLEANRIGWGCSGRNGGQGQFASGRLTRPQWVAHWGLETARRMHAEIAEGFRTFEGLVAGIDCDAQPGGHFLIAHRAKIMKRLAHEQAFNRKYFNYETELIDAATLHSKYVGDAESHGALHEPACIAVHPMKLVYGYAKLARELGAKLRPASPVIGWTTERGVHHLRTPGGTVRARAVGVATGGYTAQTLHPQLRSRIMPILSNNAVTRPLTESEIAACNFRTHQALTDTRTLRFYYRLLPDNRVQMGSRSSITGADAENPRHRKVLVDGLHRKFPALAHLDFEYSWWGWVDVSHDMMPRIVQPDPRVTLYYALGYGGNGVSYSARAGQRMARQMAGERDEVELPVLGSPLPLPIAFRRFESRTFSPFRRLGQRGLYYWYYLRDEMF